MMNFRTHPFSRLMRLDKPIGIWLVLWPALWSLWLASGGLPPLFILVVFILGAVFMRSAGCVINDYADRHWDGAVERTALRPLVSGEVTEKQALMLFAFLILLSFILVLTLNLVTLLWSIGAVVLAALYPFTKRFTHWPQFFLGLAFAWAVPMGYAAVMGQVPHQAWWVFALVVLWALIYDTQYAMVDRQDDLAVGIKSTAIYFGDWVNEVLLGLKLLWLLGWFYFAFHYQLDGLFNLFLGLVLIIFAYQTYLMWQNNQKAYFQAFITHQWVGFFVWLGLAFSV